jgi:hypothetical protein
MDCKIVPVARKIDVFDINRVEFSLSELDIGVVGLSRAEDTKLSDSVAISETGKCFDAVTVCVAENPTVSTNPWVSKSR